MPLTRTVTSTTGHVIDRAAKEENQRRNFLELARKRGPPRSGQRGWRDACIPPGRAVRVNRPGIVSTGLFWGPWKISISHTYELQKPLRRLQRVRVHSPGRLEKPLEGEFLQCLKLTSAFWELV
ncbi:hypothetical protein R6Z07F_011906 [Ovis aries]